MSAIRKRDACLVLVSDDRRNDVRVPVGVHELAAFRRWAHSDAFPEKGRVDFIQGEVELDMSPEDLDTHGTPKVDVSAALCDEVRRRDLGRIWVDSTRLSNDEAQLSVEPDIILFLWETLESGRARLVPRAGGEPGRYVEIEGTADLIVEVVSDSSERKDTERLRERYFRAGVREYWILDARGSKLSFTVLRRTSRGYVAVRPGRGAFLQSRVLGRAVRVTRSPARMGLMTYRLEFRDKR